MFCLVGGASALRRAVRLPAALPVVLGLAWAAAASPLTELAPWEGEAKPPLELDSLDGGRLALSDHEGKVVLVHFFATWCEPCVEEMASLERLAARRRDAGLVVLAVDVREVDRRVRAFFGKHPVSFPVLLDRDGAATRAWQVTALPTSYVLDRDLVPILHAERDVDWDHADVEAALDRVFESPPGANRHDAKREEADDDEPT